MKKHHEKLEKLDPKVKRVIKTNGLLQNIMETIFWRDDGESTAPAKNGKQAEQILTAGSVCDEFVAKVPGNEQNESDGGLQPARIPFLAETANEESTEAA